MQLISTTYTLPLATNGTRGGVQIGYVENGKNYPVELSTEKMFVNVPWTDTGVVTSLTTTGTSGVSTLSGAGVLNIPEYANTQNTLTTTGTSGVATLVGEVLNIPDYTLLVATSTVLGGIELGSDTVLTQTYETGVTGELNQTYPVQLNAAQQAAISVPWTDTWIANAVTVAGYVAAPAALDANLVWKTDGSGNPAWRVDATIPDTGVTGVTLATGTSTGAPLAESITLRELTLTSYAYDGGNNIGYVPTGGTATTYLQGDGNWGAIPTGLIFKDVWDASGGGGGSPDLTAVSPSDGWLYICDAAGTAYPNGGALPPSTWALGDWCIYNGTSWTRVPATNAGVTSLTTTDGTYIDLTPNTATTGAVTVTADLSAPATGTSDVTTKFLTEGNKWQVPFYTPTGVT